MTASGASYIHLLGGFDVHVNGVPLARLRSRKGQVLIALLAVRAGKPVDRSWLAGTLWPDSSEAQALAGLRQTLADLRRALGSAASTIENSSARSLVFQPGAIDVDVAQFDAAVQRADPESLELAVRLYGGPLLAGSSDEAIWNEREQRDVAFTRVLETVAQNRSEAGDIDGAIDCYRRLVAQDPYRESAVQSLMKLNAQKGDYPEAYVAYRDLRSRLSHDLRTPPSPETVAIYEQIRRDAKHRLAPKPAPAPPENATAAPSAHGAAQPLPIPFTTLVGRHGEVNAVKGRLEAARMVTITGFGAVGKSRIAIEVGRQTAERYRDGVLYVDFAGVSPESAASHAAASSGLGQDLLQALASPFPARNAGQFLLILDNCELLAARCAQIASAVLRSFTSARVLAASRQPLKSAGELVFRVGGLGMPDISWVDRLAGSPTVEITPGLVHADAIRLFVERAARMSPGFSLTPEHAGSVSRICRMLDGHPLAIGMAAGWTNMLSVEQIEARIRSSALFLASSGPQPARHQSLRTIVADSYNQLSPANRQALGRLSVFADGWTHESTKAVCVDGEAADEDMLDCLAHLVDESLVWVDWPSPSRARYRVIPMVRQFCREHSQELPGQKEAERRFASYYASLCAAADLRPGRVRRLSEVETIEEESGNIIAALDALAENRDKGGDEAAALFCFAAFCGIKGYPGVALARLQRFISVSDAFLDPLTAAEARLILGRLQILAGDTAGALVSAQDACARCRAIGNALYEGAARSCAAEALLAGDDLSGAAAQAKEASAALGTEPPCVERSEAMRTHALVKALRGRAEAAASKAAACLDAAQASRDELAVSEALLTMGQVQDLCGDPETARRAFIASLALAEEWSAAPVAIAAIEGLAQMMLGSDDHRAALLLASAQALRSRGGLGQAYCVASPKALQSRVLLSEPTYLAERRAGARMTLSQAINAASE